MTKALKIVLYFIGIIILFAALAIGIFLWFSSPKIPELESDVPIEYKIGWWSYQKKLNISALKTKVIFKGLNLFNGTAVIEYNLKGSVSNQNNWRPYVKSVFISERWSKPSEKINLKTADVLIIPIIGVKEDENYSGEELNFNITVQDYLKTGGWGKNIYNVRSQSQVSTIELQQRK